MPTIHVELYHKLSLLRDPDLAGKFHRKCKVEVEELTLFEASELVSKYSILILYQQRTYLTVTADLITA